ncbi:MAG: hypothetical protein JSV83_24170 [Desulfobacterales bacterium]|nr:MAG: hypothetical protein JSV83_24170 [Desulfobacterales bacterium]
MIANKKKFFMGLGLMAAFVVVLIIFFSPVFYGQNGLEYLDDLYNSISKGSAYYIPKLKEEVQPLGGDKVEMTLKLKSVEQARQTSLLFQKAGALINLSETTLIVSGDLGRILLGCLDDADAMYVNDGRKVSDKYGYDERQVMYNWWTAAKEMDRDLKKQKKFKAADTVAAVEKKAVETAYNYYRIEPQKIADRYGIVIFSLIFYVIYTVWYGFAFMYMFEGWGMKLEH